MTAPTAQDDFEVWFLTGSQHLYGEETLRRVAEQSRGIAAMLSEAQAIRVKLVWKPVLTDHDAIRGTVLEANADDRVVGLVAWMHTFSPAKMWIAGLSALDKPLLHLHTQANVALPWATIDFDFMNLNQAAHGDREFGYIGARLNLRRKVITGFWQDPDVAGEIGAWTRAAVAWHDGLSFALAFDLAFVPAPFLPKPIVPQAIARTKSALRPGGSVLFATHRAMAIAGAHERAGDFVSHAAAQAASP